MRIDHSALTFVKLRPLPLLHLWARKLDVPSCPRQSAAPAGRFRRAVGSTQLFVMRDNIIVCAVTVWLYPKYFRYDLTTLFAVTKSSQELS